MIKENFMLNKSPGKNIEIIFLKVSPLSYQIRLEVAASVTVQVISTEEPLLAKMSGAPSILVMGTEMKLHSESIYH